MKQFIFSLNLIPCVIKELTEAERYIKIAIFQLHHQDVFDLLKEKCKQGVKVEIITLPYDSINEDVRDRVTKQFNELESQGAIIHLCRWNVGDPEMTTTAVGRWYSFHGKFLVTDKSSIALSANFTDQSELDAALIFHGDKDKEIEFNKKFEELLDLFVRPYGGYSGRIRSLVEKSGFEKPESLFELPKIISTSVHEDHWILQYPGNICPQKLSRENGLFILPFDARARNVIQDLISNAGGNVYISTESFTDPDICDDIIAASLSGKNIKIITGVKSRDFTDRVQNLLRNLLASGIEIRTSSYPLHAKLMITDNNVSISSVNLNKMNLGIKQAGDTWRANTETICLSKDVEIINSAKTQFESIFRSLDDVRLELAQKMEKNISNLFKKYYGINSRQEAKKLFSRFFLSEEIEVRKVALKIGKIVKKLVDKEKYVTKEIFIKAVLLHFLSDNKLTTEQITEKLSVLNTEMDLNNILYELIDQKYIEQDGVFYKLQVLKMF